MCSVADRKGVYVPSRIWDLEVIISFVDKLVIFFAFISCISSLRLLLGAVYKILSAHCPLSIPYLQVERSRAGIFQVRLLFYIHTHHHWSLPIHSWQYMIAFKQLSHVWHQNCRLSNAPGSFRSMQPGPVPSPAWSPGCDKLMPHAREITEVIN